MAEKIEYKAHKLLAELRKSLLTKIIHEAKNKVEYCQDKPEELKKWMEYISNPEKWDYCGIMRKEDLRVMEVLEYLVNDDANEIIKYK
jgi:hypothetical protein